MKANDVPLAQLHEYAEKVKHKTVSAGKPLEDHLRGPFDDLIVAVGRSQGRTLVCAGEKHLAGVGRPDYAVTEQGLLVGYIELKAPGKGTRTSSCKGHDKQQFERFRLLPNVLYSDGNTFALFRSGERTNRAARFAGDIQTDGKDAVSEQDAANLVALLTDFFSWRPKLPIGKLGDIKMRDFASMIAPLCRMLRLGVSDAVNNGQSSGLATLADNWRELLMPDASDDQFADAYAQTVAFALLLSRAEGADPLTLPNAQERLSTNYALLGKALEVLTDPSAREEVEAPLDVLLRVIGAVPPDSGGGLGAATDWLYFYEDFLAAYDPELRREAGVYYTPPSVVRAQVRMTEDVLRDRLGKNRGFLDSDVITLDPALGTGTYLLGVIDRSLKTVKSEQGEGAVPPQASQLAENLRGFEIMVGPYAVSQLRLSGALKELKASLPEKGLRVYLADTLASPNSVSPQSQLLITKVLTEQQSKALSVKREQSVMVCIGNPPWGRTEAEPSPTADSKGGWVRWGDYDNPREADPDTAILADFVRPAVEAGMGGHLKNLYNLYVYFWRWALWKVFEQDTSPDAGVVGFITASSFLAGPAFCGMRQHMREVCDEIWVLDLGGEGRGTRREENLFDVQTPCAITIAARKQPKPAPPSRDRTGSDTPPAPAKVRYAAIRGSRARKTRQLENINKMADIPWQECPTGPQAPFRPAGRGRYFGWPLISDIFPWCNSGVQFKRTWPIAPDKDTLRRRWGRLMSAPPGAERAAAFKETADRKTGPAPRTGRKTKKWTGIDLLGTHDPLPPMKRYAYRSFDRQWAFMDDRVCDAMKAGMSHAHSDRQIYMTTLTTQPLGEGPAATVCADIPDLDHFRGSYGAKNVFPLWRTPDRTEPNITPGLAEMLSVEYSKPSAGAARPIKEAFKVEPLDVFAYVYGVVAHPGFTEMFWDELETKELRIPFTKNRERFARARDIGKRLIFLHTHATRCGDGTTTGITPGEAKKHETCRCGRKRLPANVRLRRRQSRSQSRGWRVPTCVRAGLRVLCVWHERSQEMVGVPNRTRNKKEVLAVGSCPPRKMDSGTQHRAAEPVLGVGSHYRRIPRTGQASSREHSRRLFR